MIKRLSNFIAGVVAVCVVGFITGVFVAGFLLPIFTTWKFVFDAI